MNNKGIRIAVTLMAALLAVAHVIWPDVKIDAVTLGLVVLAVAPWLAPLFKSVEIPGVGKFEFQELKEAGERAETAGLLPPSTEAKADASPSPPYSFLLVADEDPNLALAGLRIEIERALSQLADQHGLAAQRRGVGGLLRDLSRAGVLEQDERAILADMIAYLNAAVHGAEVPEQAAEWAIEVGPRILAALEARTSGNVSQDS